MLRFSFIAVCFTLLMFAGCQQSQPPTPNPCASVVCENGGACNSGSCNCVNGYWGDVCSYPYQHKFYSYDATYGGAWGPCSSSIQNFPYWLEIVPVDGVTNYPFLTDNNVNVRFLNDNGTFFPTCGTSLSFIGLINNSNKLIISNDTVCGTQIINFELSISDPYDFKAEAIIEYIIAGDTQSTIITQSYCRESVN